MARIISFPFRVGRNGAVVTVEQGNESYYQEQIATILLTDQGERLVQPLLGMPDIVFQGFQYSAFQAQVSEQMPEVALVNVKVENDSDISEKIEVEFELS